MKRHARPGHELSHEDIQAAMDSFLKKGGKIEVLPNQKAVTLKVIGGEKWDAYESLQDLSF